MTRRAAVPHVQLLPAGRLSATATSPTLTQWPPLQWRRHEPTTSCLHSQTTAPRRRSSRRRAAPSSARMQAATAATPGCRAPAWPPPSSRAPRRCSLARSRAQASPPSSTFRGCRSALNAFDGATLLGWPALRVLAALLPAACRDAHSPAPKQSQLAVLLNCLPCGPCRGALLSSTDAVPALSGKISSGGRLNVGRALASLLNKQAPQPLHCAWVGCPAGLATSPCMPLMQVEPFLSVNGLASLGACDGWLWCCYDHPPCACPGCRFADAWNTEGDTYYDFRLAADTVFNCLNTTSATCMSRSACGAAQGRPPAWLPACRPASGHAAPLQAMMPRGVEPPALALHSTPAAAVRRPTGAPTRPPRPAGICERAAGAPRPVCRAC